METWHTLNTPETAIVSASSSSATVPVTVASPPLRPSSPLPLPSVSSHSSSPKIGSPSKPQEKPMTQTSKFSSTMCENETVTTGSSDKANAVIADLKKANAIQGSRRRKATTPVSQWLIYACLGS